MKTGNVFSIALAFWFCLIPLVEGDDGTLPLPNNTQSAEQKVLGEDLWDLLCR